MKMPFQISSNLTVSAMVFFGLILSRNRIEYSNLASNQRGRNPFCICGKFHESLPWSIGCGKRKEGGRTIRNFVIRLIQFGNFKISSSEYLFGTLAELASQKCVE